MGHYRMVWWFANILFSETLRDVALRAIWVTGASALRLSKPPPNHSVTASNPATHPGFKHQQIPQSVAVIDSTCDVLIEDLLDGFWAKVLMATCVGA